MRLAKNLALSQHFLVPRTFFNTHLITQYYITFAMIKYQHAAYFSSHRGSDPKLNINPTEAY